MQILFVIMILAYAAGALAALAGGRRAWGRELAAGGAAVGGAAGLALGLTALLQGGVWLLEVPALLPLGGGLALRLDGLGAVFLIVIGLGAVPAAIYGAGYTASYAADDRVSLRGLGAMLNLFLLGMSLVVLADNVLTFLLMWEGMSLTSYFLVITEHDNAENVSAGRWYVGMTHVGLAALMVAFFLLMNGGIGCVCRPARDRCQPPRSDAQPGLCAGVPRLWRQGRHRPAARLAAAWPTRPRPATFRRSCRAS